MTDSGRQPMALDAAIPESWRSNEKYHSVLVKLFPSAIHARSECLDVLDALNEVGNSLSTHPVRLVLISIETKNEVFRVETTKHYQQGQAIVLQNVSKPVLPFGEYLAALSPVARRPDGSDDDATAEQAIRLFRGIVTAGLGHAAANQPVASYASKLREEGVSFAGDVIENFIGPDRHNFLREAALREWSKRMETHLPPELAGRAATAFRILGAAAGVIDSAVRVVNTWTALEVAAGSWGKADEALNAMAKKMGLATASQLKNARNDFVHNGILPSVSEEEERVAKAAIFAIVSSYYRQNLIGE